MDMDNKKPKKEHPYRDDAEKLAAMGRYGDTMIMHVNPLEVEYLERNFPGSVTINPDTGQPEAFLQFLLPLFSAIAGGIGSAAAAAAPVASAIGAGLGSAATAVGSGLTTAATTAAGAIGSGLGAAGSAIGSGLKGIGGALASGAEAVGGMFGMGGAPNVAAPTAAEAVLTASPEALAQSVFSTAAAPGGGTFAGMPLAEVVPSFTPSLIEAAPTVLPEFAGVAMEGLAAPSLNLSSSLMSPSQIFSGIPESVGQFASTIDPFQGALDGNLAAGNQMKALTGAPDATLPFSQGGPMPQASQLGPVPQANPADAINLTGGYTQPSPTGGFPQPVDQFAPGLTGNSQPLGLGGETQGIGTIQNQFASPQGPGQAFGMEMGELVPNMLNPVQPSLLDTAGGLASDAFGGAMDWVGNHKLESAVMGLGLLDYIMRDDSVPEREKIEGYGSLQGENEPYWMKYASRPAYGPSPSYFRPGSPGSRGGQYNYYG